jgi:putative FmdB family regulatory protein
MPLYEYECPRCGRFEALQKLGASPIRTHQECGSRVRRLMSAGSFTIKGSGLRASGDRAAAPACERPRGAGCASCPSNAEA